LTKHFGKVESKILASPGKKSQTLLGKQIVKEKCLNKTTIPKLCVRGTPACQKREEEENCTRMQGGTIYNSNIGKKKEDIPPKKPVPHGPAKKRDKKKGGGKADLLSKTWSRRGAIGGGTGDG